MNLRKEKKKVRAMKKTSPSLYQLRNIRESQRKRRQKRVKAKEKKKN